MLEGVTAAYTARLSDIRRFLAFLEEVARPLGPHSRPEILTAKGLYFVELYGVFEYAVTTTVSQVVKALNDTAIPVEACQPVLLGLGLDAECKSMTAAGPKTHWEKRCSLFARTRVPDPLQIDDNVLPIGIGTIKFRHLQRIWSTFNLRDPVLPNMSLRGGLEDVTDKRMAISHGRESASDVGRRYSFDELAKRHTAIDLVCGHIVQSFETYLASEHYFFP
jgi:hypothetical protein